MSRVFFSLLVTVVALLVQGCGYTFQGGGSVLPPDIKKVYIPGVENDSSEAGLSRVLTEALRDRFDRFGTVMVVDSSNEADAILNTRIKSVSRDTHTSTSKTDTALQLRIKMSLSAELRRVGGDILWRDNNMSVSKISGAESGVVVTSSTDFLGSNLGAGDLGALGSREVERLEGEQALNAIAEDAAVAIYNSAVMPDF